MTLKQNVNNMKTNIFLLFVTFSLAYADPSTTSQGSTETSSKPETKTPNSITSAPAKTTYYSSTSTRAPAYVQLIQKPLFTAHHHAVPQTMLIIAQPALLPHNLVYNQASTLHAQQLLNYFHSNPAAKYQFLYGFQPPQEQQQHQQQYQQHQQSSTQSQPIYYATAAAAQTPHPQTHPQQQQQQHYQYLPTQQFTYVQAPPSHPAYHQYQSQSTQASTPSYHTQQYTQIPASTYTHTPQPQHQPQPYQLRQSQQTEFVPSQQIIQPPHPQQPSASHGTHFFSQGPQTFTQQTPIKTAPPIITGLENFTPEQQAQIKEQLSSHFGSITQINSNSLQANPNVEYATSSKFRIEVQPTEGEYATSTTQTESNNLKPEARELQQSHQQVQQQQHHYVSHSATAGNGGFVPPTYTFRTPQYTKG